MPSDVCILLNPASGGGAQVSEVRSRIGGLPGFELRVCDDPTHLSDMAADAAADGYERVAAAGGDGSVAAVAAGLVRSGLKVRLGVVPIGTGNDFARGLGIPLDTARAIDCLASPRVRSIDLIRCRAAQVPGGERLSLNAAVGGIAGRIGDAMTSKISRRWGRFAYLRVGIAELLTGIPSPIVLRIDGKQFSLDCLMLVVANGRFAGGAIPFAPAADPSDGRLDVVAIPGMPRISLLRTAVRVLRGRHDGTHGLIIRSGRSVEIAAGPSFWFNLDGETWVAGAARFDVVPLALEVVVP